MRSRSLGLGATVAALGGLTASLAPLLGEEQLVDVALLYLLLTLVASGVWGCIVGLCTALLANLLLNFFFVPPLHTFSVQQPENVISLMVFLAVAGIGASMLAMLRQQVEIAVAGQAEAGLLLDVSQAMGRAPNPEAALGELCQAVTDGLGLERCLVLRHEAEWQIAGVSEGRAEDQRLVSLEQKWSDEALRTEAIVRPADSGRTFIAFPGGGERAGVLLLVGRVRTPPRVDHERLLRALAAEARVALHRVELADEARRADELERADALKSTLLSSVSHDLRSPLTAIKAAVGSLSDERIEWSQQDAKGLLDTIETQTDRLTDVVSELLEMARLESGASPVHFEPIEVSLLLRDVTQTAAPGTQGRVVSVDARAGLWICADYRLVMQALGNLVDNAARYSVPGGAIRLAAEEAPGAVTIAVCDEGPGIPDKDLPHIFEKFYRGVQGRRSRGSGLGLAIAKAMVELSGGTIAVRSSFRGTVFSVRFAAAEPP